MQDINYKLKNKSGIYSFLNLVNGKRYVGSSVDLYNRLHVHNLKNNKAHIFKMLGINMEKIILFIIL